MSISVCILVTIFYLLLISSVIPLDLFVPLIQDTVHQKTGWKFDSQTLDVSLSTSTNRIEFMAKEVKIFTPQDVLIVTIPELRITFSLESLSRMDSDSIIPYELALESPTFFISADISAATPSLTTTISSEPSYDTQELSSDTQELSRNSTDFLNSFFALPPQDCTSSFPEIITITDAQIVLTHPEHDQTWIGQKGDLYVHRTSTQTYIDATVVFDIDNHPINVTVAMHHAASSCMVTINVEVTPILPRILAKFVPVTFVPILTIVDNSEVRGFMSIELFVSSPWYVTEIHFSLLQINESLITFPDDLVESGLMPETVRVTTLIVDGIFNQITSTVDITHLILSLREPDLKLHGTMALSFNNERTAQWRFYVQREGFSSRFIGQLGSSFEDSSQDAIITLTNFLPHTFADFLPILTPLTTVSTSMSAEVRLRFDEHNNPLSAQIDVHGAQGQIRSVETLLQPLDFKAITINATVHDLNQPTLHRVEITNFNLILDPTILSGTATLARQGEGIALSAELQALDIPISSLPSLWPVKFVRSARSWIIRNITQGLVTRTWLKITGSVPFDHPDEWSMAVSEIGFVAQDLTLTYYKTMTPIRELDGHGFTDGQILTIHTQNGTITADNKLDEPIILGQGKIIIDNLADRDLYQSLTLDLGLKGNVSSTLEILDQQPLSLKQKQPILSHLTEGQHTTQLHLSFLLLRNLALEDIVLSVDMILHDVTISELQDLITIENINGTFSYTNERTSGLFDGFLHDVPVHFEFIHEVNETGQDIQNITASLSADVTDLQWLEIPSRFNVIGWVEVRGMVTLMNHHITGHGTIDLTQASFELPTFDYVKQNHEMARLHGRFILIDNTARLIIALQASEMIINGEGILSQTDTTLALTRATVEVKIKDTYLTGSLNVDQRGSYNVFVYSPLFDARALIDDLLTSPSLPPDQETTEESDRVTEIKPKFMAEKPDLVLHIELHIEQLRLMNADLSLNGLVIKISYRNQSWDRIAITGRLGTTTRRVEISTIPRQNNNDNNHKKIHDVMIDIEDLGYLLHVFNLTDQVLDGHAQIKGKIDSTNSDLEAYGTIEIAHYRVTDLPIIIQIMNLLPPIGGMEFLFREGLSFDRLTADVQWHNQRLTISNALGLTKNLRISLSEGMIDFENQTLDIIGSIGILEVVNRLFEQLPRLDSLFVGTARGGLTATVYRIHGPYDDPSVEVNILTTFIPGILRERLFTGPRE